MSGHFLGPGGRGRVRLGFRRHSNTVRTRAERPTMVFVEGIRKGGLGSWGQEQGEINREERVWGRGML